MRFSRICTLGCNSRIRQALLEPAKKADLELLYRAKGRLVTVEAGVRKCEAGF